MAEALDKQPAPTKQYRNKTLQGQDTLPLGLMASLVLTSLQQKDVFLTSG